MVHIRLKTKSFTIIELAVVISIILFLSSIVTWAVSEMWHQCNLDNSHSSMRSFIKTIRSEAQLNMHSYGIFFYIDPNLDAQSMIIVKLNSAPRLGTDEAYPDVADRYTIDYSGIHVFNFLDTIRFAPVEILDCKIGEEECEEYFWDDDDIANDDYREPNIHDEYKHRNFFVIICNKHGDWIRPIVVINDEDNDNDGFGDITNLVVGEVLGDAGGPVEDMVKSNDDKIISFPVTRGVVVYDETMLRELLPVDWPIFLRQQTSRIIILTPTGVDYAEHFQG